MTLNYIIDGYNLIHAIPSLKKMLAHDAPQAREALVHLLTRLTLNKKIRCTVVFDGVARPHRPAGATHAPLHVVFSSPLNADARIKSMIEQSKNRSQLTIVSSDREILDFAKVCSCSTLTSQSFSSLLFREPGRGEEKDSTPLSKTEVEEWMKIFSEKRQG